VNQDGDPSSLVVNGFNLRCYFSFLFDKMQEDYESTFVIIIVVCVMYYYFSCNVIVIIILVVR